jgi:hypothetical protein
MVCINGLRQVTMCDGCRDARNTPDLLGERAAHSIDALREVEPDALHSVDVCHTTELALRPDLTRDAGDLVGEAAERVDHRVDDLFELEHDLALDLDLDGDLLGEVAARDGAAHAGDVHDLLAEERELVNGLLAPHPRGGHERRRLGHHGRRVGHFGEYAGGVRVAAVGAGAGSRGGVGSAVVAVPCGVMNRLVLV